MTPDIRPPENCVVVDASELASNKHTFELWQLLRPHGLCMLCVEYDPANFNNENLRCLERPCAIRTGCDSPMENKTHSVLFLSASKFAELRLEYGLRASEYHKPTAP